MEKLSKKIINKFKTDVSMDKVSNGKQKKKEESKKEKTDKRSDGEKDEEDEEDDADEVPFEEKVKFTEKVRRLTNEGLTKLVKKIKEVCPEALDDVNAEKLHIKVDSIDKESFAKLD